jgi:two-component system sensor histidine kinase and response regulator WspE
VQIEGRQHFWHEGRHIGLVAASQLLNRPAAQDAASLRVVVIREREQLYGVAVERLIGERVLVVMPLDPRLGKVQDISSGALLDDGSVVLIVDVEDMLRSVDKLLSTGRLERIERGSSRPGRRASACWWSTTR